MTTRRPFEEGWDAGLRGYSDPRVICPYDKQTKEHKEWHKFYSMAVEFRSAGKPEEGITMLERLRKAITRLWD